MAGQKNGRSSGKSNSPRYSERYGANRPNPYTGYLPPGAAPAGQLYHPESVNMEKVGQIMAEKNASDLIAVAASRATGEAEVKSKMDTEKEKTIASGNAQRDENRNGNGNQSNSGQSGQKKNRKRRRNGDAEKKSQTAISEEQRQKLQQIQEEAAAEMVTDLLTESIIDAAENGSAIQTKKAETAPAADDDSDDIETDWSNMHITSKFQRSRNKKSEGPFDPSRFEDAEVRENPFDANYFSDDDDAAGFVPPLEIFSSGSEDEKVEEKDTEETEVEVAEIAEDTTPAETEEAAEESEDAAESADDENELQDGDESDSVTDEEASQEGAEESEDESSDEDETESTEDEAEQDSTEEEDSADNEEQDSEADEAEESEEMDEEESEESEEDDQEEDVFNGVDWETPDEPDDEDSDMIIVDENAAQNTETGIVAVNSKEHSVIRVIGDGYTPEESDEEQDDSLFLRKEKVEGGTEVFNLPEGVKLPTYIDDDEFLEQWLNEGEDMAIKDKRLRRRVSTVIGTLTMIFAMVGFVWVIHYAFGALAGIGNTDETKEKYTDFISPVVMSEVQPFESWSAIPAEKLLQSAIFHVLTNMEESYYDTDDTNKIVIPSGDVAAAVQELYGEAAVLGADALNVLDSDDAYYSDTDDCFHVAATGISGPQPEIVAISRKGSEVTLTVGYLDETGVASSDGYYLTMTYVLQVSGDDMYIKAIRSVEA